MGGGSADSELYSTALPVKVLTEGSSEKLISPLSATLFPDCSQFVGRTGKRQTVIVILLTKQQKYLPGLTLTLAMVSPSIQSFSKDFGSSIAFSAAGEGNPIIELIYKNQLIQKQLNKSTTLRGFRGILVCKSIQPN